MANLQLTKNLYEYRKANALTQKDVSAYLNISRQAYSNYETGKRDPDLGLLVKLSELYEISLNQLIVDSFRSSTLMFREVCPPYTVAHREHSDTTLILTEDECDLILKYRQASEEDRRLVRKVLHEKRAVKPPHSGKFTALFFYFLPALFFTGTLFAGSSIRPA